MTVTSVLFTKLKNNSKSHLIHWSAVSNNFSSKSTPNLKKSSSICQLYHLSTPLLAKPINNNMYLKAGQVCKVSSKKYILFKKILKRPNTMKKDSWEWLLKLLENFLWLNRPLFSRMILVCGKSYQAFINR